MSIRENARMQVSTSGNNTITLKCLSVLKQYLRTAQLSQYVDLTTPGLSPTSLLPGTDHAHGVNNTSTLLVIPVLHS